MRHWVVIYKGVEGISANDLLGKGTSMQLDSFAYLCIATEQQQTLAKKINTYHCPVSRRHNVSSCF